MRTSSSTHVTDELGVAVGQLVVHSKSGHVYEPEWALMAEIAASDEFSVARGS